MVSGIAYNLYSHTASDGFILRDQPRAGWGENKEVFCSQELIVLDDLGSQASPGLLTIS